ncbi:MAG: hypothetical protein H6534_07095 [Chthonomonadaceae bacterium]|nr:hypothetical protein [Chthonomonadaceae bacterium]
MITFLLAASILAPSAADYFPLVPGTKWHYEEHVGKGVTIHLDEVLEPVDVGGHPATPIASSLNGHVYDTVYYRVVDDTVMLVAYDAKKPLELPVPILKVGDGRIRWEHVGETQLANEPAALSMKCESAPKGEREVLGRRVPVIELKVDASVGGSDMTGIRNRQTAIYAKGIGLVELKGEGTVGPRTTKFERKLVKFEPGGAS